MPPRAVIYTRVSNDDSGRSRSTKDQERECREICARNNWPVAEVLCDNDIGASRWSNKERPAYKQLAQVLQPGDVLVSWEASRTGRDLKDYVELRELCVTRGVQLSYNGRLYNLDDPDDRFGTALDALLAEKEAEQTRVRILRGKRSAAAAGRPGGRPPYGYLPQRDPTTGRTITWIPDPTAAPIVTEAIRRTLAGESLWTIARDFTNRKLPAPSTSPGKYRENAQWLPRRLRTMVLSPSYAGLRVHQGKVIGKGTWNGLITEEDHQRLVSILTDPRRATYTGDTTAKYLLSGIARCGVCGGKVNVSRQSASPNYFCGPHGCIRRKQELVDARVTDLLLSRLEAFNPAAYDDLPEDARKAISEASELRQRLDDFAERAAEGELSAAMLARVERNLLPKIAAAERRASVSHSPIIGVVAGPHARQSWESMAILERRELVREMLTVTINRSTVSKRHFNPDDIAVTWLR